jgi:hypothetical protein
MTIAQTFQVLAPDGETVAAEVLLQDGGSAAVLHCPDDFHTPDTLDQIGDACVRMAALIRAREV